LQQSDPLHSVALLRRATTGHATALLSPAMNVRLMIVGSGQQCFRDGEARLAG
jgi:hypothetical protein